MVLDVSLKLQDFVCFRCKDVSRSGSCGASKRKLLRRNCLRPGMETETLGTFPSHPVPTTYFIFHLF